MIALKARKYLEKESIALIPESYFIRLSESQAKY
jgi:hypothetical protein